MKDITKRILKEMTEKNTKVVSAFPGVGKSHYYRSNNIQNFQTGDNRIVMDSDSSKFPKSNFPENYMQHIKRHIGVADIILVSSHDVVRDALVKEGIPFTLVYPDKKMKKEFIQRYINRKSDPKFIELLDKNWDNWITEMENQTGCEHIVLQPNQYLSDVI